MYRIAISILGAFALAACGTSTNGGTSGTGTGGGTTGGCAGPNTTVTISGFAFTPADCDAGTCNNVTVPSPSTITFINKDASVPHSATSESAASAYDGKPANPGFSFDTGLFTGAASGNSTATLCIPSGVASGTVQPYYCKQHKSMMSNPNPTITIQ